MTRAHCAGCHPHLGEQRQQWASATWAPKSTQTFDEVADHWLKLREADSSIGPTIVRADRESLAYARRAFGAAPVRGLTPAALVDWSASLTGKGGKPLPMASGRRHRWASSSITSPLTALPGVSRSRFLGCAARRSAGCGCPTSTWRAARHTSSRLGSTSTGAT